eukprot:CAMPEP_0202481502 /NCGR_PEP_ID=MMETSP1361-20130828/1038_1 /ASSEMBLY_ACC=CAM_ASM_000849 /TAXON_ID=210615 /ORGANISM="Staurosira complex sp., Strain CCMP2646" /LENGTH=590 /DNA_ID=CAMNT_0049109013 /DNA_START=43 /DNA_END=1815 /DNA_ORIENTATION=-
MMRRISLSLTRHRSPVTTMSTILMMTMVLVSVNASLPEVADKLDCVGGACPSASPTLDGPGCGLWLGPSPIKQAEDHGFGLGVFTGTPIPKGATVETEILIPIHDSLLHNENHHPPLREYVWNGENMPEVVMESQRGSFLFMSGLAAIAPCTSKNYNLELRGRGDGVNAARHNVVSDSGDVHRATSPMAGAFSYRHNVSYTAVRDIVVGEELTVQCSDDDYDGGSYVLSKFEPNDSAVVCIDSNVRVAPLELGGQGLFAKHVLHKGSVITSTPVVPMDRKELVLEKDTSKDVTRQQLLLNYCYGHPDSDLLLLPYGPMVNYINHPPQGKSANAIIRWHQVSDKNSNDVLPRRQQHHHPELFQESAKTVAKTHGKGLMMDIVALRKISPDEEIYIDYGKDFEEAYKAHIAQWQPTEKDKLYRSAEHYTRTHDVSTIRTTREQQTNPYPENLATACFWDEDDPDDQATDAVYSWSDDEEIDECLRPCVILDRYVHEETGEEMYMAKMMPMDNTEVSSFCYLQEPEIVSDVPRRAIRIIDRPYTTDTFMKNTFRHEIGVPEGFYPDEWMRKKLRGNSQDDSPDFGVEFKRKTA